MLVGWQFDLRIKLEPDREARAARRARRVPEGGAPPSGPGLRIHILQWDAAMLATLARQVLPFLALELVWHRRIHFRLDSDHPVGACHHQKIIVVDDALAFCGGIDMTDDRWDTREHRDGDPLPASGRTAAPYRPFHDATGGRGRRRGAGAGRARARALALRRPASGWRRRRAGSDAWPDGLAPDPAPRSTSAIARTHPQRTGPPAGARDRPRSTPTR